jgi:hypothetical protein
MKGKIMCENDEDYDALKEFSYYLYENRENCSILFNIINTYNESLFKKSKNFENFSKSSFICKSIKTLFPKLDYVDKNGLDFIYDNRILIELKTRKEMFQKKKTNPIIIKNLIKNLNETKTFSVLWMIQTDKPYKMGLTTYTSAKKFKKFCYSRTECQIPFEYIQFIEIQNDIKHLEINIQKEQDEFENNLINKLINRLK